MRNPQKVSRILLAFAVCCMIWADYWSYSIAEHASPQWGADILNGTAAAPLQYRIGVIRLAWFLKRHAHLGLRHTFALLDLACATLVVYLLYSLFERSGVYQAASDSARWFGAAAFVLLIQYNFLWVTWYQRPETLASSATVAATLWLLSVRLPISTKWASVLPAAGMVALAGIQGLVRADVTFALHLGILLICLTPAGRLLSLPRGVQAAISIAAALLSGGIQSYLAHVVYPNAAYPPGRVFQGLVNVTPGRLLPFGLFMMPYLWMVCKVLGRRCKPESPAAAFLSGSAVYLVLWWALGNFDEVRIFLPFALASVPLTVICAMQCFLTPAPALEWQEELPSAERI